MVNNLELRMYGIVPYNLSPIQQGIQFGHAVVEYGQKMKNDNLYNDWANNWKTFIILNGGTTNTKIKDGFPFGTLNNHLITLQEHKIELATFYESDLGDQLTAVVFIVDERVFNRIKYPDFEDWVIQNYGDLINGVGNSYQIAKRIKESQSLEDQKVYQSWIRMVGGEKNVFLRDFLHPKNFKLA